jgi:hypothetical protein
MHADLPDQCAAGFGSDAHQDQNNVGLVPTVAVLHSAGLQERVW